MRCAVHNFSSNHEGGLHCHRRSLKEKGELLPNAQCAPSSANYLSRDTGPHARTLTESEFFSMPGTRNHRSKHTENITEKKKLKAVAALPHAAINVANQKSRANLAMANTITGQNQIAAPGIASSFAAPTSPTTRRG